MKIAQKLVISYYRAKLNMLSVISKRHAAKSAFTLFCTPMRRTRIKSAKVFERGESIHFTFQNYTIRGYRWNHPSEKKALILHGFESTIKNFDRYISALVKKGYEVCAFDAPAHGNSTGKRISLPVYLATVRKIQELYGPFDSFVAHSFGGLVLSHFLETIKDNANLKVVLIAPVTEIVSSMDSFFRFLHIGNGVREEFDKLIYERSGFMPDHYSIRRAMNSIRSQVLWFHDQTDELTPVSDALKVMADNHDNVRFRITNGLGHRGIYRDNKIYKETIEFL